MHNASLVVASCGDDLSWTAAFSGNVFVVEQCKSQHAHPYVIHARRCGREASSYLSFIVQKWEQLPDNMCFVQGDAPSHFGRLGKQPHFRVHPLASFSMLDGTGSLGVSSCQINWRESLPFHQLVANVSHPVTTYTYAHFCVSARRFKARPLHFYDRLLAAVYAGESDSAQCRKGIASTMERLWPLVFGCSTLRRYAHRIRNPSSKDYRTACPGVFCCAGSRGLVDGEISPIACANWHTAAQRGSL